jgi:RNA polymerase sigma-70 factor (ECF subfamily)
LELWSGFTGTAAKMTLLSAQAAEPIPSQTGEEVVELFEELRTPLLRYVISLGIPVQDGEEVVQEVFLALFQHLNRGKDRQNLRGWIFRVAHNLALKKFCSTKSRVERASITIDSVEGDLISSAPNPEEILEQRRLSERVQAVIRALPEQDRRCLHLRVEGLRYREIADVLGISLGSVANSLERAIVKLKRAKDRQVCTYE